MTTNSTVLAEEIRKALGALNDVYTSGAFVALLDELWALPPGQHRQRFVRDVILNPSILEARGVVLPAGVELQRTYFDDDRPTLFALVAHLPEDQDLTWRKVTITVDDIDSMAPGLAEPRPGT